MKTFNVLKILSKGLLLLSILSCGSSNTVANNSTDINEYTSKKDTRQQARVQLIKDLNLRTDQKEEVQTIIQESQEQLRQLRDSGDDRRSKVRQMQATSTETDNKLKLILDDDQFETYQAFKQKQREEMRAQMQNRRANRKGQ